MKNKDISGRVVTSNEPVWLKPRDKSGDQGSSGGKRPSRYTVDMIDRGTGEYLGCFVDSLGRAPSATDYVRVFKGLARAVAEDQAWPADIRIFMLMLWQLEYGNFLAVSQRDISAFLVVSRNTVSRVVRRMLDANIIQSDKYKGASGYRLNPNYVHMGSDAQRAARRREWTAMLKAEAKK